MELSGRIGNRLSQKYWTNKQYETAKFLQEQHLK
jgi:hypothetical protein